LFHEEKYMTIGNGEIAQIFQNGMGINPITGGPAGSLKSVIAVTIPYKICVSSPGPSSGVMDLTAIFIPVGQTISNINFVTAGTGATGPTHWWFALYDDGRGSSTAGQLALLGQTADQTSTAMAANTNFGLALFTPWVTQYTGIYYIGYMQTVSTTMATLTGSLRGGGGTASVILSSNCTSSFYSGTAGSGLTNQAPNPSGAITVSARTEFAYVS
jgi:hypothetical protein